MIVEKPKKTKPLTKKEIAWLAKVEDVFKDCPSDRLGIYTVGDSTLHVYDKDKIELCKDEDISDNGATDGGIYLGQISTEIMIEGVSG